MAGVQLITQPGSGTFSLSSDAALMIVECWGAGGAGGAAVGNVSSNGPGGAGGAYVRSFFWGVTANNFQLFVGDYTISVTSSAVHGSASWFGSTAAGYYVYARGGSGGAPALAQNDSGIRVLALTAGSVGNDVIYAGGHGATNATASNQLGGGGGGGAGYGGTGINGATGIGGLGGPNFIILDEFSAIFNRAGGTGGSGALVGINNREGGTGSPPGGGGAGGKVSGSSLDRVGGWGARGQIIVTWYDIPVSPIGSGFFGL